MKKCMKFLVAAMVLTMAIFCTGCAKEVVVTVNDLGVAAELATKTGKTIETVLTEGGYVLADNDETVPERSEKLKEEVTDITILRYAEVTVVKGSDTKAVSVTGGCVADALKEAGITLGEGEYTSISEDTFLESGMEIQILQKQKVAITVDGTTSDVYTDAATIADLLAQAGITLGEHDRVTPAATEKVAADLTEVKVERVEIKEETVKEEIPFGTTQVNSSKMNAGTSQVTTAGVNGEKEVTYAITIVDGKEESREVISENVTKEAVTQVVTVGTKKAASTSSGGKKVVSKEKQYDCDGSGHGYYIITYSDGTVEYKDF